MLHIDRTPAHQYDYTYQLDEDYQKNSWPTWLSSTATYYGIVNKQEAINDFKKLGIKVKMCWTSYTSCELYFLFKNNNDLNLYRLAGSIKESEFLKFKVTAPFWKRLLKI